MEVPPAAEEPTIPPEAVEPAAASEPVLTNGNAAVKGGKLDSVANGGFVSQMTSDVISAIAATEGTGSTLQYIASGIGAAIQSVVGIDPINPEKVRPRILCHFLPTTNNSVDCGGAICRASREGA